MTMPDEIKTVTIDTPPVTVKVIGGTGEGRLIQDTLAQTPGTQANLIIKVVTPFAQILVRASRVFLQSVLGLLAAGTAVSKLLPAADFLHLLLLSASLSISITVICVIQNVIELLTKFDQSNPTLAG